MEWTKASLEKLAELYEARMPLSKIAKVLETTKGAVAGAIHRRLKGQRDTQPRKCGTQPGAKHPHNSIHYNLIEPWAEFTARKQKERAEAKAAALQVALTGQDSD